LKNTGNVQTLLIIEDDEGLQHQLKWCFSDYDVKLAGDRLKAIDILQKHDPQVITLDLGLPPDSANVSEGFSVLEEILSVSPRAKVIVITGNDDRENALKAIAKGAYDYYQKPVDPDILGIIVERAFHLSNLENEIRLLAIKNPISPLDGIITANSKMLEVCHMVEKVAPTDAAILLFGESGTGKEILAHSVHDLSSRSDEKFVTINCAAIPESLLESELFGYEKGAFTGATNSKIGKIERANKGTLFLDEIGELPMSLQAKLLRFLQEKTIERIGGKGEIKVDVRIITATHRDLDEMIKQDKFREDLYYRISEIVVRIPPLRERAGDAVLLAKNFLSKMASQTKSTAQSFSKDALLVIDQYQWPGNIRELKNKIKRAVIMSESKIVTEKELEIDIDDNKSEVLKLRDIREVAEYEAIIKALEISGNNISQAADILGVSRPTLYDLLNKHNLK
jgi:two-component system, NtrC family, response regulator